MACCTQPLGQQQSTGSEQSALLASTGGTSPVDRGTRPHDQVGRNVGGEFQVSEDDGAELLRW